MSSTGSNAATDLDVWSIDRDTQRLIDHALRLGPVCTFTVHDDAPITITRKEVGIISCFLRDGSSHPGCCPVCSTTQLFGRRKRYIRNRCERLHCRLQKCACAHEDWPNPQCPCPFEALDTESANKGDSEHEASELVVH